VFSDCALWHGRDEKFIQKVWTRNVNRKYHLGELGMYVRIILKQIQINV
jgi:hypothetical protein